MVLETFSSLKLKIKNHIKRLGFVWRRKKSCKLESFPRVVWNNLSDDLSHIILMSFPLMILYRKLDLGPNPILLKCLLIKKFCPRLDNLTFFFSFSLWDWTIDFYNHHIVQKAYKFLQICIDTMDGRCRSRIPNLCKQKIKDRLVKPLHKIFQDQFIFYYLWSEMPKNWLQAWSYFLHFILFFIFFI